MRRLILSSVAWLPCALSSQGPDRNDTRLLADPAISAHHIAFTYAEDLWVCDRDGQNARRLTAHEGSETRPRFSADGSTIAFSAQYDGNRDVYVIPVTGGTPTRLTWHPDSDNVQDVAADGRILFTSGRATYTNRYQQLFEVAPTGDQPTALPVPHANKACYSPNGKHLAYVPLYEAFRQWKNYRGGTTSRIWIYDRESHAVEQVPQPEGRCNDTDPMWLPSGLYFLSDRDGEFNLFRHVPGGTPEALTQHTDFPILAASAGDGVIVYEQAGHLHVFDPATTSSGRVVIGVATELLETRPRWVDGNDFVQNANVSPTGARAVFETRGEIVTMPAEKGDPRNLTRTSGVHERDPAWSPDGGQIAFLSDAGGEYQLHIVPQQGGEPRVLPLEGTGFYRDLRWSPDGEHIAYADNGLSLYWLEVESGAITRVATESVYGVDETSYSWSPDSRWIAYTHKTRTLFRQAFVYSLDSGESIPVTDGLSDVGEPIFDDSGKYLYLVGSTDAGPVRQWFAMSNADMRMTHSLYLVVLAANTPSPLLPESDEEPVAALEAEQPVTPPADDPKPAPMVVDADGLQQRILEIHVPRGFIRNLRPGPGNQLFYLRAQPGSGREPATLYRYDLVEREEKHVATNVDRFEVSANRKKLFLRSNGWYLIAAAQPDTNIVEGRLNTREMRLHIDPREEWAQIFDEAWRINRDYFYDPGMHGADWPAMREKYRVFLPHLATRSDLNRVIQWLCSELAVGHHRVGGGDRLGQPDSIPTGLLGADYEIAEGRYRFAKVYGGLNWNPGLRAPLTEPGVNVTAGDYLLAVDGVELRAPDNLYRLFENKADRQVRLRVGPAPDGTDAHDVVVVPVANERTLRHRDWVEGNMRRVHEATDGRVAYVYVPNTANLGHLYFKRYFFPQADKQAIIIDERHNGGGQIADYLIDILNRPALSWWTTRYGEDFKGPLMSIQGPKVMLIDETAGSGGDLLPWMFRKMELGTLVGRRTWGGLVGILGFPRLIDGGTVTAPNLGFWTEDGFRVENEGVPPDIEVEQWPAERIAGRDPQLEKAIEVVLEQLAADPPTTPRRPDFPIRAR